MYKDKKIVAIVRKNRLVKLENYVTIEKIEVMEGDV